MSRWFGSPLLSLLSLAVLCDTGCSDSGSSEDPCRADLDAIRSCNRFIKGEVCSTDEGRCAAACYAQAQCVEYAAIDNDRPPAWLMQCLTPCWERFSCANGESVLLRWQCDGYADCTDGSDERGCEYFVCDDKQRVPESARCDRMPDCRDESDEEGC